MFRHYRVIFRQLVFITSPSYVFQLQLLAIQFKLISRGVAYTATTQMHFVRIVTIMILPHFISNWTILMF